MFMTCISSGSSGNCYILQNKNEALLIECGCKPIDVKKALNFNISKIVGCIVSHCHNDHAGYTKNYENMGIKVVKPYESDVCKVQLGNFTVKFFDLVHDVPCYGAWIHEPSMGTMIFITDTEYCKYKFAKVNHILCEANYDKDLLATGHEENVRKRVYQTHMSIDTTCEFLKANKSDNLRNVILCHLSGDCSNADDFIAKAQSVVDCDVYVARKGLEIELNKE